MLSLKAWQTQESAIKTLLTTVLINAVGHLESRDVTTVKGKRVKGVQAYSIVSFEAIPDENNVSYKR